MRKLRLREMAHSHRQMRLEEETNSGLYLTWSSRDSAQVRERSPGKSRAETETHLLRGRVSGGAAEWFLARLQFRLGTQAQRSQGPLNWWIWHYFENLFDFVDISKLILKFLWRQKTQDTQHNIEEQTGGLTLPNFKTYYTIFICWLSLYKAGKNKKQTKRKLIQWVSGVQLW